MYLSEFQIPSMVFNAVLKTRITDYLYGGGGGGGGSSGSGTDPPTLGVGVTSGGSLALDIFPNITSRHLPMVSKFMSFWTENCCVSDDEIEMEIDELSTLFNEYIMNSATTASAASAASTVNITDSALLGMIRHFYPDVIIEDDKYLINVGCKMWTKKAEIRSYLELFKVQCISNHLSIPQPLYNAYEYYCSKCYESTERRAASKRYFEKFFIEEYTDYLDENGLITMAWWNETSDDGNDGVV
jgi:hypothetical protein